MSIKVKSTSITHLYKAKEEIVTEAKADDFTSYSISLVCESERSEGSSCEKSGIG